MLGNWLDEMWYSGYGNETLEFSQGTALNSAGAAARIEWLHKHIPTCRGCGFASILKSIEADVARELGRFEEFQHGADITGHPNSSEKIKQHLAAAIQAGTIDAAIIVWVRKMVKRQGRPWSGRIQ